MAFDPLIAVHRFGLGPSPVLAPPRDPSELIDEATVRDPFARSHPILTTKELVALDAAYRDRRGQVRKAEGQAAKDAAREAARQVSTQARDRAFQDFRALLVRHVGRPYGLSERLVSFWTDHFTAVGSGGISQYATAAYSNDAIRPHIMGRFADMARAVLRSPLMLNYLDQVLSTGPNSRIGQRRKGRGLNENLAREFLELHTLGVDGPYSQDDVRQLAALLTGLSLERGKGFVFRPGIVEPGAERVLDRLYGGDTLEAIDAVVDDLALHPETARHLARKMAVHFVSDTPDEGLVRHISSRYLASDGDLAVATAALLEHPAAWDPVRRNVKWPIDYISSSFRALGLEAAQVETAGLKDVRTLAVTPLSRMGQPWRRPPDPAGWEEEDTSWVTPQAVAERVNWAMRAPVRLTAELPDPRELLALIAGDTAPPELRFAVDAAQNRQEGVGLVLASPSFQRR
ncbi:MAG: DUF1800 domain-containing protein [Rhodobacteraceae bacterium]|nr:DUF1800 domain-containing protein [Paracoccaceae bacterium]